MKRMKIKRPCNRCVFQLFKTLDPDPHRWLDEPVLGIGCGNTGIWIFNFF